MKKILNRGLSLVLALIMVFGLLPVTAFAAVDSTGRPTDLNNTLVLSIYTPEGSFPGEPATHGSADYISFNSSFAKTSASGKFKNSAVGELKASVLSDLVQGASSGNNTVWGVFSADGLKEKYFESEASIIQPANEAKIIRVIKGNAVKNMSDDEILKEYEIIWYVIKLQHSSGWWWSSGTTEWHIDGLVREKSDTLISINYYGNGNTEGAAPDGITNHVAGDDYTILASNNMKKKINGVEVAFLGWSAKADGTGEEAGFYQPGAVIRPTQSISLYAMWDTTTQHTATVNTYLDGVLTDDTDIHGEIRDLYMSTDAVHYYHLARTSEGVYSVKITGNGKFFLYTKDPSGTYTQADTHQLTIYNQNGTLDIHHYSVTYDPNGGAFAVDPGKQIYHHGDAVTAIAATPTREGYRFLGWKDNNGNLIQPGDHLTASISAPIKLTAQWEKTVSVTINVTINHEDKVNGGYDRMADKDDVFLALVSRANDTSPYLEVVGKTLTLDKGTVPENQKVTTYTGYTYADMPGGTVDYAVVTSKSGYDTTITPTQDAEGNWIIDVVMDYKPTNFDIAFTVEVDDDVPDRYIPDAAIVKVTFWSTDRNRWEIITQQEGGLPGVRVDFDENGFGSGTYPVWKYESESTTPYGYRIQITSFVYPDDTIVPASHVVTQDVAWTDNVYTATVSDVTGGQQFGTLDGAYIDDASGAQKGTLKAVITMDLHNVTFDAQGGKVNGLDQQTVTEQFQIPAFKGYVPTRAGGYIFDGWYLDQACTQKATEGTDLTQDITLYAKWIEPLTISGSIAISGTYELDGKTVPVNEIDKATEAVIVLQEIRDGKAYEVDSQTVEVTYGEDKNGTAAYSFTEIPNEGKEYRIQLLLPNYTTQYDNERDEGISYDTDEYPAIFGDNNEALVHGALTFVPPSYVQDMKVDAEKIASGYRPDSVLAQILYRNTGDNHPFHVISQHGEDSPAPHGVPIELDPATGIGTGSESIWKWHTNGTLYDYQMDVVKVTGSKYSSESFNSDDAPFYITYTEPVYWDSDTNAYSGIMVATLIPKTYAVTFDLNAGTDSVTGMDAFKVPAQDDETDETYAYDKGHTWSYATSIENALPQREGYNFLGWETTVTGVSSDANGNVTISADVQQEVALKAIWEEITYTVTTAPDPVEGGATTGDGTYVYGSDVTIVATPAEGYSFQGWYEGDTLVSKDLSYSFKIFGKHDFTAKFSLNRHTVTTAAIPSTGGTTTGDGVYDYNTVVTISAAPNTGYTFTGWYNGIEKISDEQSFQVTVTEDLSYTAQFELNMYRVTTTATPAEGGTTSGDGTYFHGTQVTVQATAETGYSFVGWFEDGVKVSSDAAYSFEATGSRDLVAQFSLNRHTVTTAAIPSMGGTTTGDGVYDYGTVVTISAAPNTGYTFTGWYNGIEKISDEQSFQVTVTEDLSYTAQFERNMYRVTTTATPAEGGTTSGDGTYFHGTQVTVQATAETGYAFVGWFEDGVKVSEDAAYSFEATGDRNLAAEFEKIVYQVTANAEPGGTAEGTASYHYGDTATVKATVDATYTFDGWYEGTEKVSDDLEYTFTVTSNRELTAKFTKNGYQVDAFPNNPDFGTTTGSGYYDEGSEATVTATPKDGHKFLGWFEDGVQVSSDASYTFTVDKSHVLFAHFAPAYTITALAQNGGSASGTGVYTAADTVTIRAEADSSHYFIGWYDETDEFVSSDAVYTLPFKITADRTFTAKFAAKVSYKCDYVYIFGYNNSEIGAEGPLLRGELAQMIYRLVKQNKGVSNGGNSFSDTAGEWFESGISYMAKVGAIELKSNAYPYASVIRGEAYKMICLGLGFTTDTTLGYSDYASLLKNSGYLKDDGRVTATMQRWEFCELFNAILGRSNYCLDGYFDTNGNEVTAETYGYTDLSPADDYYRIMMIATSTFTNEKIDLAKRIERNTYDFTN